MGNFVTFLGACFILGELALVSYPFYYYGVVGLALASVAGCGWLMSPGASFVLLELFVEHLGRTSAGSVYSPLTPLTLTPFQKYGVWKSCLVWHVASFGCGCGSSSECWLGADTVDNWVSPLCDWVLVG